MTMEFILIVLLSAIVAASLVVFLVWLVKRRRFLQSNGKSENLFATTVKQNMASRNDKAISDIEKLILKDNNGHELALTRPDTKQLSEKKYREICVRGSSAAAQVLQGAMPMLAHAQTLREIAKAAPNGLFTATDSIQNLMKYSDGTVGSIVMNNGKIAAHAGFAEVAVKAINPVAIVGASMQAMALISGQYYMHQISKQLKNVDRKLDKLIGYHHDEKIGILRNVNRELQKLVSNTNVDAADIIACQRLEEKCGEVYYEYLTRLEGARVDSKERLFNKSKELRKLGTSIDESEINFSIQMCYEASLLREKCKLAEIAARMKIGGSQERFISEQVENLCKTRNEAFHRNIRRYIDERYAPVLDKAKKIIESRKLPSWLNDTSKQATNIQRRKEVILEKVAEDEIEENLVEKMLSSFMQPKETLILLGETPDAQRVFVLDESE